MLQERQKGMTFLGYALVLGIIGFFAIMAMKLAPLYLEYQSVVKIMNSVATESAPMTPPNAIRTAIQRRLDVNNIERISAKDFRISRERGGTEVQLYYEARTKFMGNLWFLLEFENNVVLRGS